MHYNDFQIILLKLHIRLQLQLQLFRCMSLQIYTQILLFSAFLRLECVCDQQILSLARTSQSDVSLKFALVSHYDTLTFEIK